MAPPLASETARSSQGGLSSGAKAGIGVGVSIGFIALIALGFFVWKALQWRKMAYAATPTPTFEMPDAHESAGAYQYNGGAKERAQLASVEHTVHELPQAADSTMDHTVRP